MVTNGSRGAATITNAAISAYVPRRLPMPMERTRFTFKANNGFVWIQRRDSTVKSSGRRRSQISQRWRSARRDVQHHQDAASTGGVICAVGSGVDLLSPANGHRRVRALIDVRQRRTLRRWFNCPISYPTTATSNLSAYAICLTPRLCKCGAKQRGPCAGSRPSLLRITANPEPQPAVGGYCGRCRDVGRGKILYGTGWWPSTTPREPSRPVHSVG